jgi:hypothetical protein
MDTEIWGMAVVMKRAKELLSLPPEPEGLGEGMKVDGFLQFA